MCSESPRNNSYCYYVTSRCRINKVWKLSSYNLSQDLHVEVSQIPHLLRSPQLSIILNPFDRMW